MFFETYDQIHQDIFVRIVGLPIIDKIREIRCALRKIWRRGVGGACIQGR